MKKFFGVLLVIQFFSFNGYSQVLKAKSKSIQNNQVVSDSSRLSDKSSSNKNIKNKDAKISQYLIIDSNNVQTFVDTSLTISKAYKFNYLRKDNFGLLPFANLGQTYNKLTRDFTELIRLPQFGARARHFNYMEIEDMYYYEVPTPFTELFFKTAFQQGQLLDAFFTANTSKQFNFSIGYKGLRSLGDYQHAITSTGNLRFTTNYRSNDQKYRVKAHIAMQDLLNEENGGLTSADTANFISGDEDFIDRAVFDPNFQNAENILVGKRFYLNQEYNITTASDSLGNSLLVRNVISFEDKYFQFDQTTSSGFFGDAFKQNGLRDRVTLENFSTKVFIDYNDSNVGLLSLGLAYSDLNYGYDKITVLNNQVIPNRVKDRVLGVEGSYATQFGDIVLNSDFGFNVSGDFGGSYFLGQASYQPKEDFNLTALVNINSSAPNFNLLLNQSNYINYNWNNTSDFENQKNVDFKLQLKSKELFNVSLQYTVIDNFSLFNSEVALNDSTAVVKPRQLSETISFYKVRFDKELKFGKFALDNSIIYQKVFDDSQLLNLPDVVIRNTIYYSNHFFNKKALFLQTGITFNYFTEYYMDGYDPLLAEFYSQTQTKLGGFPRLDFFINAKIRQTRIYLMAEHFNASFTGYNYFSAPNTPYRDFAIRFGLVWNFFL